MTTDATARTRVSLTGVSETALLTLQVRANEARRPDGLIKDPMAVQLVDSIDFDFAKFGHSHRQDMALRSLIFDRATSDYLRDHPKATVVALAEGLQTSFYRLNEAGVGDQFCWLTVDLPPMVEIRNKLLPPSDRVRTRAQSALDYSWMDQVDDSEGVFITAEGLLMYLQPEESMGLIKECARRFPDGQMIFDLPPSWFAAWARKGMRTSRRYRVPPMPFSLSPAEVADLVNTVPGVRVVHDLPFPPARGKFMRTVVWGVQRLPLFDPIRPVMALLEFG
ncbi:class I SAM-dependent methyltransferase [Mycolicibacterium smegmatis]|uniref:class I SAM-dependent methyltransferase n=1 Tax=Mycolicibacterium smegmatis TaxID=1772 RepID=UPI0005D9A8B5|nr:class I SAM-dependent methyltransferase [Mycolicibacterium smegmatis]MDF1900438.1 class I SAM-dependent methyltransferase [Mycolicibacterium smegmatis]MDF1906201.1 class I SAM-dependent methyltransferase [Mycolicibacterium smegmatis]MDF1916335.1 class I SAM-dependent methyltransferase [Mycolicibacterium smegmatis]MDF1922823.1 class I SAM-dependent methyltransferase [Mycolicibacterium smegmatis]UAK56723.1 class I SAM-dependent methyltransferase [Mycolicibacterium smegmatis]